MQKSLFVTFFLVLVSGWTFALPTLVASWPLEGSGNTMTDITGNGHTGTLENMDSSNRVVGQVGNALDFDGANERVSIGSGNFTSGASSIVLRVNPDIAQSKPMAELKIDNTGLLLYQTGTSIVMAFRGASNQFQTASGGLTIGDWNHIAFVYNGGAKAASGSYEMYINGSLQSSLTGLGAVGGSFGGNFLGFENSGFFFDGQLDEVTIWDGALTSLEVNSLFSDVVPEPSSLILLVLGLVGVLHRMKMSK